MAEGRPTYKSYLLRLWREDAAHASWRASLESITQGDERRHFPDVDSLVAFLLAELGASRPASSAGSAGNREDMGTDSQNSK
jgi:hypothetical protein